MEVVVGGDVADAIAIFAALHGHILYVIENTGLTHPGESNGQDGVFLYGSNAHFPPVEGIELYSCDSH